MARVAALLTALVVVASGCIRISPEANEAFGRAVGEAFAGIAEADRDLKFVVSWYYQTEGEWPNDRGTLERFIEKHGAPISLEDYTELALETDADDVLSCRYRRRLSPTRPHDTQSLSVPSVGSRFRLTTQEALDRKQHFTDPDCLYWHMFPRESCEWNTTDEETTSGR